MGAPASAPQAHAAVFDASQLTPLRLSVATFVGCLAQPLLSGNMPHTRSDPLKERR